MTANGQVLLLAIQDNGRQTLSCCCDVNVAAAIKPSKNNLMETRAEGEGEEGQKSHQEAAQSPKEVSN